MCKSEYKLTRKMQWDSDVLKVQDEIHDVLREAKQSMTDAMTGMVLSHFECDLSDFREYMHDKIKWERKQELAMPRWIPVTERFPDAEDHYLAAYKLANGEAYCDILYYGFMDFKADEGMCFYKYDSEWGDVKYDGVTHWMRMPEIPKEDI